MTEHHCIHEADLAVLNSVIPEMAENIKDMKKEVAENIKEIRKILKGNGNPGLETRVAVLESWRETFPTPKALTFYASVGGGIVVFVALLGKWAIGG